MAPRKSAMVESYRPSRAQRLMNIHRPSIRFRLGKYEGRNKSVIPNCAAKIRANDQRQHKNVPNTNWAASTKNTSPRPARASSQRGFSSVSRKSE